MGIGLAYAAYMSGSIWIGALMHFINNGLSVVFQYHPDLVTMIPILGQENYSAGDMVILLVVGAVITSLGVLLMKKPKNAE